MVTGGAGFIGANLCRQLLDTPGIGRVIAFDDLSTGNPRNLEGTNADLVVGSILDTHELDPVLEQADAIVHLAARPSVPRSVADPVPSHLVNASGTVNVLEGARRDGGRQIIVASSSSVYGANPELPKHEGLATRPISPYAASKLAAEAYTLAYGHSYELPALAFRFFNVFGPLQAAGHAYAAVVPAFLDAALRNQPLTVHGDGTQSRDFTYVGTVTSVITDAILRRVSCAEPVNLAFGTRTTLLSVIELIAELLDQELELQHIENRAGDVPHSQAAGDLVAELFPTIEPRPLREGLETTAAWMKSTLLPA
ncbi:MAG: NAD-dependent epimerase/dehydratase family protein [Acidimicrobiales bacterium]|nr:NAD-dependent epimerase/dehydratase family protein [Acidimicrobiales bacterium]